MKKGLLLTLAAMATLTLASCVSEVTYIEELPYKEALVVSKRNEILKNITTELDNAHYFESYSKTYNRKKNGDINTTQSVKLKEFQGDYVEMEIVSENHSKYDGYDGYSKGTSNYYLYYDSTSQYMYLLVDGMNAHSSKTKISQSASQSAFENALSSYNDLSRLWKYASLFTAYSNGDGYALVYNNESEYSTISKRVKDDYLRGKKQTQIILEADSNYRITKFTIYQADLCNYDSDSDEEFDNLTVLESSTITMKFSYNDMEARPSNYMDHFKKLTENN